MSIARDLANVASLVASSSANVVFDDSIILTGGTANSFLYLDASKRVTVATPPTGIPTLNIVSGTTQTAVAGNHYVLTNVSATTLTLPATPTAGDLVWVTVGNGLTTNVVARNGSNIQGLAEDLTLNSTYAAVQMRYINSTLGWTFV